MVNLAVPGTLAPLAEYGKRLLYKEKRRYGAATKVTSHSCMHQYRALTIKGTWHVSRYQLLFLSAPRSSHLCLQVSW